MSCGCLRIEGVTRHGEYLTKEYTAWQQAKKRCNNKNDKDYLSYGGRGIKFSEVWLDYVTFKNDMGTCPKGYSLGRVNNDGDYCKANCEWQNTTTQIRNRRNTVYLTYKGVTRPLSEWAELVNIKYVTLKKRIEGGWSVEKAIETKTETKFRRKET